MNSNEILNAIIDILEIESDSINMDTELSGVEEWDSMAAVSFLALCDSKFNKLINPAELRSCKTFGDLVKLIIE